MQKKLRILFVTTVFCLGLTLGISNSFAQSGGSLATQLYLHYKIVAWDADTLGSITSSTTAINMGVYVTNDSLYNINLNINTIPGKPSLSLGSLRVINIRSNPAMGEPENDFTITSTYPSTTGLTIEPFNTFFFRLANSSGYNFALNRLSMNHGVRVILNCPISFTANPTVQSGSSFTFITNLVATDIVYLPGNENLIPSILNNQLNSNTK